MSAIAANEHNVKEAIGQVKRLVAEASAKATMAILSYNATYEKYERANEALLAAQALDPQEMAKAIRERIAEGKPVKTVEELKEEVAELEIEIR